MLQATLLAFSLMAAMVGAAAAANVSDLAGNTHIHGLAFDKADPARIYVATHHGVFLAATTGDLTQASAEADDFMGFTPHPSDPAMLYASGHPKAGGNLGFIASSDAGRTWTKISPGVDGPVDFHQLAVAASSPAVLYGAFKGIQKSVDAGATWRMAGAAPAGLIDLAVSSADPSVVFAATETGLLVSRDGAANWETLVADVPVTTVEVAPDGAIFIFVAGEGLFRASEPALDFARIETAVPGDSYLLHLAIDASPSARMIAAAAGKVVMESTDGGKSWMPFGE